MIKIEGFNFNDKGEIIGLGTKSLTKRILFNNLAFENIRDLFIYLKNDILGSKEDREDRILIEMINKQNKKQVVDLFKVEKEKEKLKIFSFNDKLLNYQPFCEVNETSEMLISSKLTNETKNFVVKAMKIKK